MPQQFQFGDIDSTHMLNAIYYMTLFLLYHSPFQPSLEDIFAGCFESRACRVTCGSTNDFDEENGK